MNEKISKTDEEIEELKKEIYRRNEEIKKYQLELSMESDEDKKMDLRDILNELRKDKDELRKEKNKWAELLLKKRYLEMRREMNKGEANIIQITCVGTLNNRLLCGIGPFNTYRVFIREIYKSFSDILFNNHSTHPYITGSPGTGKSCFRVYLLHLLVEKNGSGVHLWLL